MRALVWHGADRLAYEELAEPAASDDGVVFEVGLASICGSDLHPYRGHPGPRQPSLVLGHEAIGRVPGRPGRFALFPLVSCGACAACTRGEEQLCERRGLVGLDRQGVFAERVAVAEDALVPLPESLDERAAILVEPLATSVSALRIDGVPAGALVAVVGGGPIGLLAVHAATSLGAQVLVAEPLPRRRALAERLGATKSFASADELPPGAADLVIDAVGIAPTWTAGVRAVRSGGTVCVVGLGQAEGVAPVGDLVRRGVSLRGHYAYTRSDFADALDLLERDPPPLDWIDLVPFDELAEGFRRLVDDPDGVAKIVARIG